MGSPSTAKTRVLAVDDNAEALFALEALLSQKGFAVESASSGEAALVALDEHEIDLILLDVNMPGMDGLEVTRRVKADPELRLIPLMLLTANNELESIIAGLDAGADNYVIKPYQADELIARIHAMVRTQSVFAALRSSVRESHDLRAIVRQESSFANIIGKSSSMCELFTLIGKVKDAHVPVLITGESGTGKELVARAIHFNGPRKNRPFIAVNCSAFNENLLESELFGHIKGAFTGAARDKQGLFEAADKGTFFLDELGEMPLALQAKLLRVLQDGTFMAVGGTATKKVDVRIVGATNRNLPEMISKGLFREDLFYRLNVINLRLPPLRERKEDIPALVDHFLTQSAARSQSLQKQVTHEVVRRLMDYNWPGNIRELQNEVERMSIMCGADAQIVAQHLSEQILSTRPVCTQRIEGKLKDALDSLERELIAQALERHQGNKSHAAEELGISRTSLIKKAQVYGLG